MIKVEVKRFYRVSNTTVQQLSLYYHTYKPLMDAGRYISASKKKEEIYIVTWAFRIVILTITI